jgi:hypothetical protein
LAGFGNKKKIQKLCTLQGMFLPLALPTAMLLPQEVPCLTENHGHEKQHIFQSNFADLILRHLLNYLLHKGGQGNSCELPDGAKMESKEMAIRRQRVVQCNM